MREPISKKIRFEVFKRDSFTCQYCGRKAPDIILHIDHINPVANNGPNTVLNYVTSCIDCNSGKGARTLSDSSQVEKKRKQLEVLQERREQIEMMFEWQSGLMDLEDQLIIKFEQFWKKRTNTKLSEVGRLKAKKLFKKFTISEVLKAADDCLTKYIYFKKSSPETPTIDSVQQAFESIKKTCDFNRMDPTVRRIYYIRGILKNKFNLGWYSPETLNEILKLLNKAVELGAELDDLESIAKRNYNQVAEWFNYMGEITQELEHYNSGGPAAGQLN